MACQAAFLKGASRPLRRPTKTCHQKNIGYGVQRFTPMIHFLLLATLLYAVQATLPAAEEIILTDFESGSYQDWKVE